MVIAIHLRFRPLLANDLGFTLDIDLYALEDQKNQILLMWKDFV